MLYGSLEISFVTVVILTVKRVSHNNIFEELINDPLVLYTIINNNIIAIAKL